MKGQMNSLNKQTNKRINEPENITNEWTNKQKENKWRMKQMNDEWKINESMKAWIEWLTEQSNKMTKWTSE